MIDIRLPDISGKTEAEQLAQIRSYLYQFAGQLNWALNTLEKGTSGNDSLVVQGGGSSPATSENDAVSNFSEIKSLIIKSADIVEAYYEEIEKKLSGHYVAQSEFGEYASSTSALIQANSESLTQYYTKTETIKQIESATESLRRHDGYIRSGTVKTYLMSEDVDKEEDTTGIEIGNFTSDDESSKKVFARFTARGIELFGETLSDKPVAYMRSNKLYITNAEFTGVLKIGGYLVETTNGLSFKWVGR